MIELSLNQSANSFLPGYELENVITPKKKEIKKERKNERKKEAQ